MRGEIDLVCSTLAAAEAYLLRSAARANDPYVAGALRRAARCLFQATNPGRPPIDDADAISASIAVMARGIERDHAIRLTVGRLGGGRAMQRRLQKKVPEII
jgi:hypothetical protein